jgi:hypothetical protein
MPSQLRSSEYITWNNMLQRCTNPKKDSYLRYGGRGIKVCKRWLKFKNFVADMGIKPSPAHSIERINNSKGYCPSNCRWATRYEQRRNMRMNHWITFKGKTMCLADWARELGIWYMTLHGRLARGWSVADAFTLPRDRTESLRRTGRAKQAARTHCVRGHKFTEKNTYWKPTKSGYHKICRTCDRIKAMNYRRRQVVQIGNAAGVSHD